MKSTEQAKPASCKGRCDSCGLVGDGLGAPPRPGGLSGWRLAVAAMVTFLLPLAGAMAGVAAVGDNPVSQLIAAFGGLLAGVVVAVVITKCRLRPPKPCQTNKEQQENR